MLYRLCGFSDLLFYSQRTHGAGKLNLRRECTSEWSGRPRLYRTGAWRLNRVQVEGYDTEAATPIIVDSFDWSEIARLYDQLRQVEDRNIDTVAKAQARGQAYLRQSEIESDSGIIRIPVNCGQQLYDVIDVTDARAGLSAEKKRVLGLTLVYNPRRGEYEERLLLGAV